MWHILKAEMSYNGVRFWLMIILIICTLDLIGLEGESASPLIFIYMFVALHTWYNLRNKGRRVNQQVRLPIPIRQVAAARILFVVLIGFGMVTLYISTNLVITSELLPYLSKSFLYLGAIVIGFSIYFILRDLLLDSFRKLEFIKEKRRMMFILFLCVVIFFFIITILSIIPLHLPTGKPVSQFMQFFLAFDPFDNVYGIMGFMFLSILPAFLTVFTFGYRKSYLE